GILKLGQSREEKLKRVALKVDGADIAFALQQEHLCLCHDYVGTGYSFLSELSAMILVCHSAEAKLRR
ncbi:UNVERIFIED_CONTAM: Cell division control protein 6 B, partial [Sesamum indicum]